MTRYDIEQFSKRLDGIRLEDNPRLVQQKSRDFYWYSPILKRQLDAVTADVIAYATSESDVLRILATAHEFGIPVTPRGTGTGNYGQAMPLSGGIVLDLSGFDQILDVKKGRYVAAPGAIMARIDAETKARSDQELRLFPSTYATATIGGFIAGGSGGVGSVRWGGLRDFGNILRLKVATMERNPRILELTGEDLHKVSHAYGTNGIITEIEMPLSPAYSWVDVFVGFDTLAGATSYANALAEQDGLLLKELAVIAAPIPHDYFPRHRKFLPRAKHLVIAIAADFAVDALAAFTRRFAGADLLLRVDKLTDEEKHGLPPAYELAWNHTTLRALRVDPGYTYLQVLYPFPDQQRLVDTIHTHFGDEVQCHLEFVRFDGKVTCFGLPLVRYTSDERLEEIMKIHEDMGAPIFNPHRYTLEEGGMKQTDDIQLAFKREADPDGLLNPGKMIAWEDPSYDYASGKNFLFRGLTSR